MLFKSKIKISKIAQLSHTNCGLSHCIAYANWILFLLPRLHIDCELITISIQQTENTSEALGLVIATDLQIILTARYGRLSNIF